MYKYKLYYILIYIIKRALNINKNVWCSYEPSKKKNVINIWYVHTCARVYACMYNV